MSDRASSSSRLVGVDTRASRPHGPYDFRLHTTQVVPADVAEAATGAEVGELLVAGGDGEASLLAVKGGEGCSLFSEGGVLSPLKVDGDSKNVGFIAFRRRKRALITCYSG